MTTGKTIALTRRTLVGKVMSLLLNMPSRLVITFLPRSKRLLMLVVMYGCESWTVKKAEYRRIDALNCGVGEDS